MNPGNPPKKKRKEKGVYKREEWEWKKLGFKLETRKCKVASKTAARLTKLSYIYIYVRERERERERDKRFKTRTYKKKRERERERQERCAIGGQS